MHFVLVLSQRLSEKTLAQKFFFHRCNKNKTFAFVYITLKEYMKDIWMIWILIDILRGEIHDNFYFLRYILAIFLLMTVFFNNYFWRYFMSIFKAVLTEQALDQSFYLKLSHTWDHLITTWTWFCPFLTTFLPTSTCSFFILNVDNNWHFMTNWQLPPSSCPRRF